MGQWKLLTWGVQLMWKRSHAFASFELWIVVEKVQGKSWLAPRPQWEQNASFHTYLAPTLAVHEKKLAKENDKHAHSFKSPIQILGLNYILLSSLFSTNSTVTSICKSFISSSSNMWSREIQQTLNNPRMPKPNRHWYIWCTKHIQHTVSNVYHLLYVGMCEQWIVPCTNPRLQFLYHHWENRQDIIGKSSATYDNLLWTAQSDYFELLI